MIFNFVPYKSFGSLKFSMDRKTVRQCLGWSYIETSLDPFSKSVPADFFNKELFVYYDHAGKCTAFEFAPADANQIPIEVQWNGENIFYANYHDLLEYSRSIDNSIVINKVGFKCLKYGYGAWCPDYVYDKEMMPQSLIFFCKGYYDSE